MASGLINSSQPGARPQPLLFPRSILGISSRWDLVSLTHQEQLGKSRECLQHQEERECSLPLGININWHWAFLHAASVGPCYLPVGFHSQNAICQPSVQPLVAPEVTLLRYPSAQHRLLLIIIVNMNCYSLLLLLMFFFLFLSTILNVLYAFISFNPYPHPTGYHH